MNGSLFKAVVFSLIAGSVFAEDVQLPAPQKTGGMPLMEALAARASNRDFSPRELEPQQLSNLLWAAFGINRDDGRRTAPSARNYQEIDLYVALPSGLYIYNPQSNLLKQLFSEDIRKSVGKQGFTQKAPVNLIYVADYDRIKDEKDFYSATDTGFISQNVYLFCASEGLNTVVLGWVDRKKLHAEMKLKSSQNIILTQPIGFPEDQE